MGKTARNAFIICLGALCACMSRAEMEKRIIEACKNGDDKLVEKLVSKDSSLVSYADSFGRTPLHYAETERIAEILSEAGADIGSRDELDQTPLHTAANAEVALFLINKGADVNALAQRRLTPLHTAATEGVANALLDYGANPYSSGASGAVSPLRWTVEKGRAGAAKALLARGATLQEKLPQKKTLLHLAAADGSPEMIDLLLDNGGDANAQDKFGATPPHYAAKGNKVSAAERLLERGADVNAKLSRNVKLVQVVSRRLGPMAGDMDSKAAGGGTPLSLAASDEMRELLKKYGGQ